MRGSALVKMASPFSLFPLASARTQAVVAAAAIHFAAATADRLAEVSAVATVVVAGSTVVTVVVAGGAA